MRASDIREKSDAELRTQIAELEEERFRLKFRSATETLEDPLRLRWIRKDIARMKTILRERELTGATVTAKSAAAAPAKGAKKKSASTSRATSATATKRAAKR
jgi:large subunit ribosomal protein L29